MHFIEIFMHFKAYSNGTNTIYCRDKSDADIIKNYKVTGNPIKIKHCLD